jgi:uncharacterized RDD family membrane protein YckC
MNSPEGQPEPEPADNEIYFDPETVDASEQFFSASLESVAARPSFEVEPAEDVALNSDLGGRASSPVLNEALGPELSQSENTNTDHVAHSSDSAPPSDWRDVVSAKVKQYKTLKPRKERYPSLQLQFDAGPSWKYESASRAHAETVTSFLAQPEPPPVREPEPPVFIQPTTDSSARVLEFPRPGMLPFNRDELAEPVVDRPRIVEAPELQPLPPALGGILIEPPLEPEPERQPGLDMPFKTTSLSRRALASAVDAIFVGCALGIFAYMFLRFNTSLPQPRGIIGMGAMLGGVLWFAYQYAFLTHCGTTLGLRATRLRLERFDGTSVPKRLRRGRVLASLLSCVSLGLGYAWCFFDEDELSWHDRITKTHLAPK